MSEEWEDIENEEGLSEEEMEEPVDESVLAREGAGCGSVGDVPCAWLASAPLSPSLWT